MDDIVLVICIVWHRDALPTLNHISVLTVKHTHHYYRITIRSITFFNTEFNWPIGEIIMLYQ